MTAGLRETTPWAGANGVYGDEFRQSPDYANWRPSGSGDFLLIFTLAGAGQIAWPGGEQDVHPGDVILYEPHAYQDYRTKPGAPRWHLLWAHFELEARWLPWVDWPRVAPGVKHLHLPKGQPRAAFATALREAGSLSRRSGHCFPELALNALERSLLLAAKSATSEQQRADPRIQKAVEFAALNSHLALTVEMLAKQCGLSLSRFAHLFRSEVGASPVVFLESERLRRAANLLRFTKLRVAEIAEKTGYQNAFYFSNRFKKKHGLSPLDFRRAALEPPPERRRPSR